MVIHDDTLDRTTNGSGLTSETLAADLQGLGAGNPQLQEKVSNELERLGAAEPVFGERFAGEKVPTLEQVLTRSRGKAGVVIELKYYGHDEQLEQRVSDVVAET